MKHLYTYLALFCAAGAVSCSKYTIQGTSDLQAVDGRMLYLRDASGTDVKNIDSCDVVHGKFKFAGPLDTVRIALVCLDGDPIMPVVLEDGDVRCVIDGQRQHCTGTPLNDTLTAFNRRYEQLAEEMGNLSRRQSQAIMNGENVDSVNQVLALRQQQLAAQEDRLVTQFITQNFDNCLSVYAFQLVTSSYEYPQLTPWIEALLTKSTPSFRNAPYVKEYLDAAEHNRDVMVDAAEPQMAPPPPPPAGAPAPPTPNQMAEPKR